MANNVIIRKANKDYVCDVCGHIIKAGSEYLDRVILNNGKCVQHERYHDQCPKVSSVEKLFHELEKNSGDLIVVNKAGIKIHIVGIAYKAVDEPIIIYREWMSNNKKTIDFSEIKNYYDHNGKSLI